LSGEGRARLRGKPDHRFRKNFGRPFAAGLFGENVENGLGENWASIRRRSKRLSAIDKPSGRSKSAIAWWLVKPL